MVTRFTENPKVPLNPPDYSDKPHVQLQGPSKTVDKEYTCKRQTLEPHAQILPILVWKETHRHKQQTSQDYTKQHTQTHTVACTKLFHLNALQLCE